MKKIGLLSVLVAASACSSPSEELPQQATDDITAGEIVAGKSPYYWANISFEEHENTMAMLGAQTQGSYTADDDPLRVRLQQWADRMDAAMRRVTLNEVAPKPIVKVLKSGSTFNAWSSGTYVSLGVPFGDPLSQSESYSLYSVLLSSPRVGVSEFALEEVLFPKPSNWIRPASFTQVWNLAKGECKLSSAGGRITGCGAAYKTPDVVTVATSPFIVFATDLVSQLDENTTVFVMAHELAHMYRAHSSPLVERKYDFWYDHGPNVAKRPIPSARHQELQATYERVTRAANALDYVGDAQLHARSRLPLVGLAGAGAFDACPAYQTWSTQYSLQSLHDVAPHGYPTYEIAESYVALERTVLNECPKTEIFTRDVESPNQLPLSTISNHLLVYAAPYVVPAASETVASYLQRLEESSYELEQEEAEFVKLVDDERIGLYTTEQEADEVALELVTRIGFTKKQGIDAWLGFMRAVDMRGLVDSASTGEASAEQCGAWLENDFLDAAGDPVEVTLGSLADNHHGSCYRLYNLWREARAHRYAVVPAPEPLAPAWDVLVDHARQLSEEAAAEGY